MTTHTQAYEAAQAVEDKSVSLVPTQSRKDYEPVLQLLYSAKEAQRNEAAGLQSIVDKEKERLNAERRSIYTHAADRVGEARLRYEKEIRAKDEKYTAEIDTQLKKLTFPLESAQQHTFENLFPQEVYAKLESAVRDTEAGKQGAAHAFVEGVLALAKDANITGTSLAQAVHAYVASEVSQQETATAEAFAELETIRKKMDRSARGPVVQLQKDLKEILKDRSKAEYAFADNLTSISPLRQYAEMGVGHARILLDGYLAGTDQKLKDGFPTPDAAKEGVTLGVLHMEGKDAVLKLSFFEEAYKQAVLQK